MSQAGINSSQDIRAIVQQVIAELRGASAPGAPTPSLSPVAPVSFAGRHGIFASVDEAVRASQEAFEQLEKLGLGHVPTIGLAKEFEEIYRPGEKEPLRLSHESGALKLLQRVRDESHRFANSYNAQLRLRKISESILDEFPNIGDRRKAALLRKFGSIQRMRLASVEQLAAVPGFGGKAAAELKVFLEARAGAGTAPP